MALPPLAHPGSEVPSGELVRAATERLLATVVAAPVGDWGRPSLLPGWTRGHVVAHLALNALGLAGVLRAAGAGRAAPMYTSQADRDQDIEDLALETPDHLVRRTRQAADEFDDAMGALSVQGWSGTFERVPGADPTPLAAVPTMRLREVEIHHADLGLDYGPRGWPPEFTLDLLESSLATQSGSGPFRLTATDLDRSWDVGEAAGSREVRGTAADLTWWLVGRGAGRGLECGSGLPELGTWPRPAPRP